MSFSIPPSPPNFRGNTFNPASYPSTVNTGLTVQGGLSYFVSYPQDKQQQHKIFLVMLSQMFQIIFQN